MVSSQPAIVRCRWYHAELERAHCSGWLLTTSEVRQLIGVKPVCPAGINIYQRGCWLFEKAGKIGGQTAWRVLKESTTAP
ncbi:MAG: hypothetical protein SVX43_18255 [Cyanobacteriota bacterium]|nr:hypothetical protein [Cyanobacteriota bacterium]